MGFKSLRGQRKKELLLFFDQQVFLRQGLASQLTLKITLARGFKLLIQRPQRTHLRNRHEEVPASVVKQSFDMSLLIRTTHQTEVILKQEVALESLKLRCHLTFSSSGDLPDGDFRVVVADSNGNSAEEFKGTLVTFQE
jgi:hypothetical protein